MIKANYYNVLYSGWVNGLLTASNVGKALFEKGYTNHPYSGTEAINHLEKVITRYCSKSGKDIYYCDQSLKSLPEEDINYIHYGLFPECISAEAVYKATGISRPEPAPVVTFPDDYDLPF